MFLEKIFKKSKDPKKELQDAAQGLSDTVLQQYSEMAAVHGVPSDMTVNVVGERGVLASVVILLSYIRYYLSTGEKGEIVVKIGHNKPPASPFTFSVNDELVDDIYPGPEIEIN